MKEFEKWDKSQCCEAQDIELCEKINGCYACTEARRQGWKKALEWVLSISEKITDAEFQCEAPVEIINAWKIREELDQNEDIEGR